ncbi:MAG: SDR family NAD(P)-dependent oxidoreductase [Pseudomonadales bacterium]
MSILITGVAGFIGTNLAQRLLDEGNEVIGLDNLCRGTRANLHNLENHPGFSFAQVDLSDAEAYRHVLADIGKGRAITDVWHLAANSDIPAGIADSQVDLRDTFLTTLNTLSIMRELGIPTLNFASTSAVYGDLGDTLLHEDVGPLFPISNYGAMKLASEAMISAALESYLQQVFIFRFPNVIGTPATHGVILDFMQRLQVQPACLDVLGDGTQQKSYLHVDDLVDAMIFVRRQAGERLNYLNIGPRDSGVTVRFIAETVRDLVAPAAQLRFGAGNKGWVGDVPRFLYSTDKLAKMGWEPRLGSAAAIQRAAREIAQQLSLPLAASAR